MKKPKQTYSRRDMLRGAATTGGMAALAVMAPGSVAAQSSEAQAPEGGDRQKGYRLTPHIIEYYKSIS